MWLNPSFRLVIKVLTIKDLIMGSINSQEYLNRYDKPFAMNILWMRPANERRRYVVTSSLIGWAHTHNDSGHNNGEGFFFIGPPIFIMIIFFVHMMSIASWEWGWCLYSMVKKWPWGICGQYFYVPIYSSNICRWELKSKFCLNLIFLSLCWDKGGCYSCNGFPSKGQFY